MERLTHKDSEGWYIEDQSVRFDMRRRGEEINRLAAYEDTGLTPEEVSRLLESMQEICEACSYNDGCEFEDCTGYQWRAHFRQGKEARQADAGAGPQTIGLTQHDMEVLEELARPLVEYLRKNHHPHTAIVVTDERVTLSEDVMSVPFGWED